MTNSGCILIGCSAPCPTCGAWVRDGKLHVCGDKPLTPKERQTLADALRREGAEPRFLRKVVRKG